MEALAADPPGGPVVLQRGAWRAEAFAGAELVVGAAEDEAEAARMFAAARRSGRAGQRDRPASLLQLPVRRRRQPLSPGRGHLDRWCRAGVRPGHPLAHRGTPARRLRALGARRASVARRPQEPESGPRRAPAILGAVCHAGAARARARAEGARPRRATRGGTKRQRLARGRGRPRLARRRRPRQSGAAHARRRARATLGRHHPLRRPGGARGPRLCAPRGQADAGGQDRPRPPAARTTSTR